MKDMMVKGKKARLTYINQTPNHTKINPLDAGRWLTDFSQTSYAAGSRLTYKTVNQRSGS